MSNSLLAVGNPLGAPTPKTDPARFGAWLENASLAHACNAGQSVAYWREEPLEVDAVLEGSWGKWAIEVKAGSVQASDLRRLLQFHRRFPVHRPLLVGTASTYDAA